MCSLATMPSPYIMKDKRKISNFLICAFSGNFPIYDIGAFTIPFPISTIKICAMLLGQVRLRKVKQIGKKCINWVEGYYCGRLQELYFKIKYKVRK